MADIKSYPARFFTEFGASLAPLCRLVSDDVREQLLLKLSSVFEDRMDAFLRPKVAKSAPAPESSPESPSGGAKAEGGGAEGAPKDEEAAEQKEIPSDLPTVLANVAEFLASAKSAFSSDAANEVQFRSDVKNLCRKMLK